MREKGTKDMEKDMAVSRSALLSLENSPLFVDKADAEEFCSTLTSYAVRRFRKEVMPFHGRYMVRSHSFVSLAGNGSFGGTVQFAVVHDGPVAGVRHTNGGPYWCGEHNVRLTFTPQ